MSRINFVPYVKSKGGFYSYKNFRNLLEQIELLGKRDNKIKEDCEDLIRLLVDATLDPEYPHAICYHKSLDLCCHWWGSREHYKRHDLQIAHISSRLPKGFS